MGYFSKLERLKRKAKGFYEDYYYELDTVSCGIQMAEMVNPRMRNAKRGFNATMDKIKALDSTAPDSRL